MSVYVMVTADFPKVDSEEREKIYKCLEKKEWKKITRVGRDITTVWRAKFKDTVSYEDAIETSEQEFITCSKSYTRSRLAIHAGPKKPVTY